MEIDAHLNSNAASHGKFSDNSNLNIVELVSPEQIRDLSGLLDQCFPVPSGYHFFDDFPIWNPAFSSVNASRIGIIEQGQLIGAAGVRMAKMHLLSTPKTATVAMIGAVASHPAYRGKGLASHCVKKAIEWAKTQGAEAAILWGSEQALYQRLGFEMMGHQCRIPLGEVQLEYSPSSSGRASSSPSATRVNRGWTPSLFDLIRQRRSGILLQQDDLGWYSAHRNVKWYYTGSIETPTAYAAFGRGIDLQNCIHEWGGDAQDLLLIFREVQKEHAGSEVALMGHPIELVRQFRFHSDPLAFVEYLCMAQVLSPRTSPFPFDRLWFWGLDAA